MLIASRPAYSLVNAHAHRTKNERKNQNRKGKGVRIKKRKIKNLPELGVLGAAK
jgi:hypothetical protein